MNSTSVLTPEKFQGLVVTFGMVVTLLEWCDGSWGACAFVPAANPRANPTDNSHKRTRHRCSVTQQSTLVLNVFFDVFLLFDVLMFVMVVTLLEWCDGRWGATAFVSAANPCANPTDNSQKRTRKPCSVTQQSILVLNVLFQRYGELDLLIQRTMQYLLFVGAVTSDWLSKDDKASYL